MFKKILIANRGIVRAHAIQAVKELGYSAATIYASLDNVSVGLFMADEIYQLQSGSPSETYYDAEGIADLAVEIDAQAVFAGYGFLADNEHFKKLLTDRGVTLISGNAGQPIDGLTNKLMQRRFLRDLGVSPVPSSGACRTLQEVEQVVRSMTYPLIMKPVTGSGGYGLTVLSGKNSDLEEAFETVSRADMEGEGGDGRKQGSSFVNEVIIEQYLANAKHIEFPVLRDHDGNVLVFPEMDCTLQRRCQKLLVETPSAYPDRQLIRQLATISRRLVEQEEFVGFASVEFLVSDGKAYFLEINSYLSPFHLATYQLTGVNLLKEQIRIFSGMPLLESQDSISARGVVVAVALNAEDPEEGFRPSPGELDSFSMPPTIGVNSYYTAHAGDTVSTFYDSLLAQVVVSDHSRADALVRMSNALAGVRIEGIKTNVEFLNAIMKSPLINGYEVVVSSLNKAEFVKELLQEARGDELGTIAAILASLALDNDENQQEILNAIAESQRSSFWSFTSRLLNRNKMDF